jgi:hypothetical protein
VVDELAVLRLEQVVGALVVMHDVAVDAGEEVHDVNDSEALAAVLEVVQRTLPDRART